MREALAEREVLLRNAPHLIRPLRFVLPHHEDLRPVWQLRAGLFLYDRLGGRKILPATQVLDLTHGAVAAPLKRRYRLGFEYSGYRVDDSRGSGGGFFAGADNHLTPTQDLFVVALIVTFDGGIHR